MITKTPRERILDTATDLFYERGVNNVGIDLVIEKSDVAKMTLYRQFGSKDDLVVAFLDRINTKWESWLRERVSTPRIRVQARPLAVFDALAEWFETPSFHGCPFITTAAEFKDPQHPVHQAAWRFKKGLLTYLQELLRDAGYTRSARLADQLLLLIDGALVRAAMEGNAEAARAAKAAAAVLLRAQAG